MKAMKYTAMALALAVGSMTLTACDESDPEATAQDEADIDSKARSQVNADEAELKEELAKAQAKDPSIKDMYYGVDDDGNKVLHIVREVKDEKTGQVQAHSDVMPLVTGMALGMMMGNMMNNNGGYNSGYAPRSSSSYNMDDERRRKNTAMGGYVASTRTSVSRSYVSSRPTSSYSTRSSGVFSSSSSARGGSYSGGG
jgi:hypothetical protein